MDQRRRATRFVEGLAEKFFEETYGGVISAKDKKSYFLKSVSSLAQGRLKRELCKYHTLYCKRFRWCIKNLRKYQDAPTCIEPDVVHCGQIPQNSGGTPTISVDQGSSDTEGAKQGEVVASGMSVSLPLETKEIRCSSKEITDRTSDSDYQHGKVCSPKKRSVYCNPPDSPDEIKVDLTSIKDHCVKRSMSVSELCTEMTVLFHQCENVSLNDKMNHAVRFYKQEVAGILKHKNIARASDLANALKSFMLYFHFKCDILHTDKEQAHLCKDTAYRCLMATMLSLYSSLNMIITRCDPNRSHRLARHTLFKACLLLENKELLMDVILQLLVKPEPVDAPYLHPTIMHVLKHPPNPCTPSSYIKHVLVCRLARYILPQDLYPEITKQLEFNRSLLPPHGLLKWLDDLCPHLISELATYAKDHQMTSYFLQIASHDLCNELQQTLYSHLGSVSPGEVWNSSGIMDDGAGSPDFSGTINIDGDAVILESHVEEVSGNHSKDISACRSQTESTESSKPIHQSDNQLCRDASKAVLSFAVPDQRDAVSCVEKTLPQKDDEGQPSEEIVVIFQETELTHRRSKDVSTHVPVISKKMEEKALRKGQKRQVKARSTDVCKKVNRNSKKEASTARTLLQESDERKGEEDLIIVQDSELDEKQQEGKSSNEIVVSRKAEAKCQERSKIDKMFPSTSEPQDTVEVIFGTVQKNRSVEKQLEYAGKDLGMEKEVKNCEQDLLEVDDMALVTPSPNTVEKAQVTGVNQNSECQKSSKPVEDFPISDSCSEESGGVDIIYDTDTNYSDYLTLRKARHLMNMFPPPDPSKGRSNGSCVVTRSRYRKSIPDAHSVKSSMDRTHKMHRSTAKESEEFQEGSPVFEYTCKRLAHIDKNRGSIGKTRKLDSDKEIFPIIQEARENRVSPNGLDLSNHLDSKTSHSKEVIEIPEPIVTMNTAKVVVGTNNEVISSSEKTARVVNHRKRTERSNSPKINDVASRQIRVNNLCGERSVMSSGLSENGLLASDGVVSVLRRSPWTLKHQDQTDVGVSSGDSYKSEYSRLATGIKKAGTHDMTCLRTSPRKGNQKDCVELMKEEGRTDNPVDTTKSDSVVDHSQVSNRFVSNLQRSSRRKGLEDKSLSSAEVAFPDINTSLREKLRQPRKSVALESHSLKRNVDQVVTPRQHKFLPCRNAKGQFVSRENDYSCEGHKTSRENFPVSIESSHPQVRSLRKRYFSENFADQSSCSSNVLASIPTSAENAALHSRTSLKVGIVPSYTQEFDPILPQSESPARSKTMNARSSGSRKTDGKGSPTNPRPKTTGASCYESRTNDGKEIPQRSDVTKLLTSGHSCRRTLYKQDSPRSSKGSSRHQHQLRSSPRVHFIRKALEFE